MSDGSQIHVATDGNSIHRSLDLEGANFPIETALHQVDVETAQAERGAVIDEVGPKLQSAQYALQLVEQQSNASLSDVKNTLRNSLSPEDYSALGIEGISDLNMMQDHLTNQID